MKSLIIFSLGLTCLAPAAWAKDCVIERYEFVFGSDTDAKMVVKSGTPCTSSINARSSIDESTIAQPPSHGTAIAVDPHHWSYQSQRNFTGTDTFVVAMTGTSYHKGRSGTVPLNGTTNLSVAVQIVP